MESDKMEIERLIKYGFRGKRVDTGEWIYGFSSYNIFSKKCYISNLVHKTILRIEVIPETVEKVVEH